jgi:hypothetical protein
MDDGVLEAGRAIRPYLVQLVGEKSAPTLDAEISGMLCEAARGIDVGGRLRALLDRRRETELFLEEVLNDAPRFRPPDMQPAFASPTRRAFELLAGDVGPILHAGRYACPGGDYVWYRPSVGAPVPDCPDHGPLVRA